MNEPNSDAPGGLKERVVVYSYGVHYKWARSLPDVVVQQLRAAHDLRSDLVTRQHEYEAEKKAIWSSYPAVEEAEIALAEAEAAAEASAATVKAERVKQQTKRIKGPAAETLRDARVAVKTAKAARREAIAAVKAEADQRLATAADGLYEHEKDMKTRYAKQGPLYYRTFDDVVAANKTAVARIRKARANGQPAALRHHRFDGTGRLAVVLLRQAGKPPRTPEVLANTDTGKYRNELALPGWVHPDEWENLSRAEQRRRGRVIARMRVGGAGIEGGGEVIDLPIQYDRMLPAEADVTGARLVIRRVGSKTKATLNVTAKLPAATPVSDGPTVAVHLGWRRDDAGVRVATWASTEPLDIPDHLTDVMTSHGGGTHGTVILPARLADRRERIEKEQGYRDDNLNAIKNQLIGWLDVHGPVEHPTYIDRDTGDPELITAGVVSRWKAPGRYAVLAHHWRDSPPVGADGHDGSDLAAALEAWRAADKNAWDREAHGSRKVTGNRNDLYAQVAAVIGYQAARVVIGDESIADLARQTSADDDLPNEVAAKIGHQRALAAPGMLRERIVTTAKREGVEVVVVEAKNLTREHAACGTINDTSLLRSHQVQCGCGRHYDVDLNAVTLMLQRGASG